MVLEKNYTARAVYDTNYFILGANRNNIETEMNDADGDDVWCADIDLDVPLPPNSLISA